MSPDPRAREERAGWLRLALTPGIGPAAARDLLAAKGTPEAVFRAGHAELARVVGPTAARALLAPDAARERAVEQALRWAESPAHHLLTLEDPAYPRPLLEIGDPPPVLYVLGNPARLASPALAVVGSRSASRAGLDNAGAFSRALGEAGLTVVSGLALGVDAAAHRGALDTAGGTVGVLGTGIDRVYPAAHAGLAEAVAARGGAIVSELPLGTEARPANFPRRNRLIAGLAMGVLVVEAAVRSGSLITARLAGEFGREVFAIPGSIHSPLSRGCHALIRQGAKLVETAADVLDELPPALFLAGGAVAGRAPQPSDDGDPLSKAIGWDPVSPEALALHWQERRPGDGPGALAARLLELELAGAIERLPDGRVQRRQGAA